MNKKTKKNIANLTLNIVSGVATYYLFKKQASNYEEIIAAYASEARKGNVQTDEEAFAQGFDEGWEAHDWVTGRDIKFPADSELRKALSGVDGDPIF